MSLASLVGGALAYPVNWWLVKNGLKHGMGTERALGKGGAKFEAEQPRLAVAPPSSSDVDNQSPMQVHDMRAMPGMGGMSGAEAMAQAHTAATQGATGDALADELGGMKMGGCGNVSAARKLLVALITLAMLAGGLALAARFGDFSMRAGGGAAGTMNMPM